MNRNWTKSVLGLNIPLNNPIQHLAHKTRVYQLQVSGLLYFQKGHSTCECEFFMVMLDLDSVYRQKHQDFHLMLIRTPMGAAGNPQRM
jgi:hypothetical protein